MKALAEICPDRLFIPPRFKRHYVPRGQGVPYLIPSQLPLIRQYGIKALSARQREKNPQFLLRAGELLIAADGTLGRVHPVTERMTGWFGSNNLARLWSSDFDMGFLYAFLVTPYGQHQLCRDIYGGMVDHITESHIGSVLVPEADSTTQKKIGKLVWKAYNYKDEAVILEDIAINEVERLIERVSTKKKKG